MLVTLVSNAPPRVAEISSGAESACAWNDLSDLSKSEREALDGLGPHALGERELARLGSRELELDELLAQMTLAAKESRREAARKRADAAREGPATPARPRAPDTRKRPADTREPAVSPRHTKRHAAVPPASAMQTDKRAPFTRSQQCPGSRRPPGSR